MAVIGDGKLGLLVAQLLVVRGFRVSLFGRHRRKLDLVEGASCTAVVDSSTAEQQAQASRRAGQAGGRGLGVAVRQAGRAGRRGLGVAVRQVGRAGRKAGGPGVGPVQRQARWSGPETNTPTSLCPPIPPATPPATPRHATPQAFSVVVEASGSPAGIRLALALCRPLGTVVLKSTCSALEAPAGPGGAAPSSRAPCWSEVANDAVVNEKRLVGSRHAVFVCARRGTGRAGGGGLWRCEEGWKGAPRRTLRPWCRASCCLNAGSRASAARPGPASRPARQLFNQASRQRRCGPFPPALDALLDVRVRRLVNGMVDAEMPLGEGVATVEAAQRAGALKVQVVCDDT